MKKVMIIALILVGALFIPSVAAAETIVSENLVYSLDTSASGTNVFSGNTGAFPTLNTIYIANVEQYSDLSYIGAEYPGNMATSLTDGENSFTYTFNGQTNTGHVYVSRQRNLLGSVTKTRLLFFFDNWNIGTSSGTKSIVLSCSLGTGSNVVTHTNWAEHNVDVFIGRGPTNGMNDWYMTIAASTTWKNNIEIVKTESPDGYLVTLDRTVDDIPYTSTINITKNGNTIFTNTQHGVLFQNWYSIDEVDGVVISNDYNSVFNYPLVDSGEIPTQPPVYRTGTVTMTDNNGTTISGFEVTAVNAYTGESYTVSTETDVTVMTLPMDRTIEIRNPQTGEYEEAPVGYYRFYGQAPGYKMLYEDGIQVSVMPEKYGSYQICDIRVTSESGYLSGQHQFQIRSRSDHSVLQSGTISAKSATTGEWYNTTVTDGIASLILPYDTSNVQSQYAGNYYVYATSPGFEDSDYATQIVVMPHTASEIRYVLLTPIGGIPTAGNVTLRIQAFSESGQGVANADIFIGGVLGEGASLWDTYTASSTGYLEVSVPGNSTYDIVASGTGFYDSARRVEVFAEDPPLIEIKLYLSGAPTVEPSDQPTGWVTPPPTQTAPPIEEDNLIGLSVKGLAKGFGIDYDTALLMFGLMIIFGAGGMVMSSVNGGAMEFIAGSIVGTFVAFALGLIPIWIFIIIAVVFGAYVLRVFIQGGQ